jgi:hypothetical protein
MSLILEKDMTNFFRQMVSKALQNQEIKADKMTESYLVDLLSKFTLLDRLEHKDTKFIHQPLAFILKEAQEGNIRQRFEKLKTLGDISLYVAGFFYDSLNKRSVDLSYYITMGEHAYKSVASLLSWYSQEDIFRRLFMELAQKFVQFVDVLGEVSECSAFKTSRGILRLYERFLRTESKWIAKKLASEGIIPYSHSGLKSIH